jgi:hypothetical protein
MAGIRLASAARFTVHPPLSHQLAAWNWLEEQQRPEVLAEFAELFRADPPVKEAPPRQATSVLLGGVPYFTQNDNASGQGWRECFSSSCAMIAAYYGKVKGDDEYNMWRKAFGDTTSATAQVKTLRHLGLDARFITNGTVALLEGELRAGRPVAVGWLHKGPVDRPSGGGHWSTLLGFDAAHWPHHDPYGEADMVNGGYVNLTKGKGIRYTRKNWERRWMVEGPGSGWCVTARPA